MQQAGLSDGLLAKKISMIQLRTYLELANFTAGIVVAIVAVVGLRQLRLLKADILTRNVRAAREKAIEASARYLSETVTATGKTYDEFTLKKLPTSYKGPIGDFTLRSLPNDWYQKAGKARFNCECVLGELNSLETVAAMFTSGVADSETGLKIIGRSFCGTIEARYDIIAMCRRKSVTAYDYLNSMVALYKAWSPRFTSEELSQARREIDAKLSGLRSQSLESIEPEI